MPTFGTASVGEVVTAQSLKRRGHDFLVGACTCACLVVVLLAGCARANDDWGDDGRILDQLQMLSESDRWVEHLTLPAQPAPCNVVVCQNVLSQRRYEFIGDPAEATIDGTRIGDGMWFVLTSDIDPNWMNDELLPFDASIRRIAFVTVLCLAVTLVIAAAKRRGRT